MSLLKAPHCGGRLAVQLMLPRPCLAIPEVLYSSEKHNDGFI